MNATIQASIFFSHSRPQPVTEAAEASGMSPTRSTSMAERISSMMNWTSDARSATRPRTRVITSGTPGPPRTETSRNLPMKLPSVAAAWDRIHVENASPAPTSTWALAMMKPEENVIRSTP